MIKSCPCRSDIPLVCFSHLRWNFVWQRPQHLMSRFAKNRPVFFIEERIDSDESLHLELTSTPEGVVVVKPYGKESSSWNIRLERALDEFLGRVGVRQFMAWYYTPMALQFSKSLRGEITVFDCMDDLKGFAFAPKDIETYERALFDRSDLVFTGGQSLYESRRGKHHAVHCFPSSVDVSHFRKALSVSTEPDDHGSIPRPRIGYFGVIDERMDLSLIDGVADAQPQWQFIMIGPVAKIADTDLPRRSNIHYLGIKSYAELPSYLGNWDVAMLPFAHNHATRFISPTKTPEYLAGGCPVVSTSVRDVVRPYGEQRMAYIADGPHSFMRAIESALNAPMTKHERASNLERFLAGRSWDATAARMESLMLDALELSARAAFITPRVDSARSKRTQVESRSRLSDAV